MQEFFEVLNLGPELIESLKSDLALRLADNLPSSWRDSEGKFSSDKEAIILLVYNWFTQAHLAFKK